MESVNEITDFWMKAGKKMLDLLIRDATIVDGTGKPAYQGSVGCRQGKLHLLPRQTEATAQRVIDGRGLTVAPGFIDAHSHGDIPLGKPFSTLSKVSQGITTEIGGQCGFSLFPVNPETLPLLRQDLAIFTDELPEEAAGFRSFGDFLAYARRQPLGTNLKMLVGHVTLRIAVMGFAHRRPTPEEMEQMKTLLRQAMEQGALGLSSGLIYIPGVYADTQELTELCRVVAEYGGIYATHMRNESKDVVQAVKEAIAVAEGAGVPLQISHHKVCGKPYWGLSSQTLRLVEEAEARGVTITIDQYPYDACMTHLNVCVPPAFFAQPGGLMAALEDPAARQEIRRQMEDSDEYDNYYRNCGGFGGIFLSRSPQMPEAEGKTILQLAEERGEDPFDTFFSILRANQGVASAIYFCMGEEDIFPILLHKDTVVGTDGILRSLEERAHPRGFGSFPRALRWFVKEKKLLTLEQMIHKMTGLPAQRLFLQNKGRIEEGLDADLAVFDWPVLQDTSDYIHSNTVARGMEYVVVAGQVVYEKGRLTGAAPGRILLHRRDG